MKRLADTDFPQLSCWVTPQQYAQQSGVYLQEAWRLLYEGARRGLFETRRWRRKGKPGRPGVRFRSRRVKNVACFFGAPGL